MPNTNKTFRVPEVDVRSTSFDLPSGEPLKAFTGRMILHKDEESDINGVKVKRRDEEMYYFMCFNWEYLQALLTDPIEFFANVLQLKDENLASPVFAMINPVNRSLMYMPSHIRNDQRRSRRVPHVECFTKEIRDLEVQSGSSVVQDDVQNKAIGEITPDDYINYRKGWFFAEFALGTHVLTIYYKRPAPKFAKKKRYNLGYTIPTISRNGTSSFGQAHYDLDIQGKDRENFEKHTADYLVDLIEDGGKRLCNDLNSQFEFFEEGEFTEVFNSSGRKVNAVDPAISDRKRAFTPNKLTKNKPGLSLVVEGLSMTKGGRFKKLNADGTETEYETFVCSQNSTYTNGQLVEFQGGVVKRYIAPAGGG